MFQRSIYEIMSTMGWDKTFWKIEFPYEKRGVSKRADFAIRNPNGRAGQSWHYIEMKPFDKTKVKDDAEKLKQATKKGSHTHLITYDWTKKLDKGPSGKTELLEKIEKKLPKTFHRTGKYAPKEHDFKTLVPRYLRNKNLREFHRKSGDCIAHGEMKTCNKPNASMIAIHTTYHTDIFDAQTRKLGSKPCMD